VASHRAQVYRERVYRDRCTGLLCTQSARSHKLRVLFKGVGRGPTLAWPGWKQPDISVKVDTARLEAGQFKKCCMECVLLYYPSTEF
jgi:hypothetical protein